jgi:hypothetical protein
MWLLAGTASACAVGLIATLVPMAIGLRAFRALLRAALLAAAIIAAALGAARVAGGRPVALVLIAAVAVAAALVVVARALWPLRRVPGDVQVARFIEERTPSLDDRLVTAVDVVAKRLPSGHAVAEPMLADAARRAGAIELDTIVPRRSLRRAGLQAAAAGAVFLLVLFAGRDTARQTIDAASLTMWPERVAFDVTPGSAHVKAGSPLPIRARLVGNRAPVLAQLQKDNPLVDPVILRHQHLQRAPAAKLIRLERQIRLARFLCANSHIGGRWKIVADQFNFAFRLRRDAERIETRYIGELPNRHSEKVVLGGCEQQIIDPHRVAPGGRKPVSEKRVASVKSIVHRQDSTL